MYWPMALGQRLAVASATALRWNSSLSVTRAPMRSPQAFQTLEAESSPMRRPSMPGTSRSPIPQMLTVPVPV